MMLQYGLEIAGARLMATLLARGLPFAVYALFASHVPRGAKLVAAASALALFAGTLGAYADPQAFALAFARAVAFLIAACVTVHALRRAAQARLISSSAVAVFSCTLFLVLPALLFRADLGVLVAVLGFELAFKSVSYCVERVTPEFEPALADCLRFLLVSPLLVYGASVQRERPAALRLAALGRVLAGAAALFAYHAAVHVLPRAGFAYDASLIRFQDLAGYGRFVAVMGANLITLYLAHSGLASLQIGCMRLLGHELPERYRLPFLARSPIDLWRRWNTYLGVWLKRYIFTPIAVGLLRRRERWAAALARVAPVVLTFLVCGLVHDLSLYLRTFTPGAGGLITFAVAALALLAWFAAERALRRVRCPRGARLALGVLCTLHVNLMLGFVALPVLAGGSLPEPLRRLISE